MKWIVLFLLSGLVWNGSAQELSLPKNPESGHCYVRSVSTAKKGGTVWKDIDCSLVQFQTLSLKFTKDHLLTDKDKKQLVKRFKKLLKGGFVIQLRSHFVSGDSDEYCVSKSKERVIQVANYLVNEGLDPDLLRVSAMGKTEKESTSIDFRLINAHSNGTPLN